MTDKCKGNIYKDKDGKLWIGVDLDDDRISLENTCDVSEGYGLPKNTVYESLDCNFWSFNNEEELSKEGLILIRQGYTYCLNDGYNFYYCNRESFEKFILDELKKIKSFEDLRVFNGKYTTWISGLKSKTITTK